jgi:hypothetical protein
VQQIGYGAKGCERGCFTWCGRIQVGPGGWDEGPRTVRQDENEIELAMAPHPAQQWKRLAFEWVARSNDGDRGRIALEVGSVMPFRSTGLTMGFC